ncbi:MAG: two-component regulator propeller domain-containing protein [bacterium]
MQHALLFWFLVFPGLLLAQNNQIRINRIAHEQGLSQSTVLCALQDRHGFMWFGTQDGLNRYDGYHFKIYKHRTGDANSLSENWVWTIFEDSAGHLWIGTFGGGVCRFDPQTESFTTYRHDAKDANSLSNDTVWSICESTPGTLWVGTNDGLNQFHLESNTFSYYKPPGDQSNIFRIVNGQPEKLWILTASGLAEFDLSAQNFLFHPLPKLESDSPPRILRNLTKGHAGILWLGTDCGLFRFDTATQKYDHYTHHPDMLQSSLPSNYISAIYEDADGVLWAGTRSQGLSLLQFDGTKLQSVQRIKHDPLNLFSISHDYVFSIYESNGGVVWIGTRDGLNRFDRHNQKFALYQASPQKANGISHKNVLPIVASRQEDGVLWVGTYDGLNRLHLSTGSVKQYKSEPKNPEGSLASSYILSLLEDDHGNLWVGTRGGLTRMHFDAGRATFRHFRFHPDDTTSLSNDNIHCLYEDRAGDLWIGTGGGGLCRFNEQNGRFTRFRFTANQPGSTVDPFVFAILEDRNGRFWLGTAAGGLYLVDRASGRFRQFSNEPDNLGSLSNNRVLCLMETRSGDIWIGTAAGLNKLMPPDSSNGEFTFIQYHETDGLPNDVIYGILEDDGGHLWISTNHGLAKVTPTATQLQVRTYTADDGLQSLEFNHNSFHKDRHGRMYFGGVNGFNAFHPDSLKDNLFPPPVVITDFKILNQSQPLTSDEITLSYNDYMLSFEFAALNFTLPQKNQYAYIMEGFDEDWIYCGTRRFATYTNLDAGKYRFRVKASNNDGVWNEEGVSVAINIKPPPWKTWWAYGLYGLLFLASVGGVIRYQIRLHEKEMAARADIERAKSEERERVRKKSSADFHDEAGHLITRISLFIELVKRKTGNDVNLAEYVNKIEENIKALSSGMRDFIWGLDPAKDSLYDTLLRLKDLGNTLFLHSDIHFHAGSIKSSFKESILPMDFRRAIMFIFKEAMNNCLKHSAADSAFLRMEYEENELVITFEDDGSGTAKAENSDSYGLKNMNARAEMIGAELEIHSNSGMGTIITLRMKL